MVYNQFQIVWLTFSFFNYFKMGLKGQIRIINKIKFYHWYSAGETDAGRPGFIMLQFVFASWIQDEEQWFFSLLCLCFFLANWWQLCTDVKQMGTSNLPTTTGWDCVCERARRRRARRRRKRGPGDWMAPEWLNEKKVLSHSFCQQTGENWLIDGESTHTIY